MARERIEALEKEITLLLLDKLEHEEITPERAGKISLFVLNTLPPNLSDEQLDTVIPKLDNTFFEIASVIHKHMKVVDTSPSMTNQALHLYSQNKLDEANNLLKDYFGKKNG